ALPSTVFPALNREDSRMKSTARKAELSPRLSEPMTMTPMRHTPMPARERREVFSRRKRKEKSTTNTAEELHRVLATKALAPFTMASAQNKRPAQRHRA